MAEYQIVPGGVRRGDSVIPDDPDNADRQRYLAWISAGGVPDDVDAHLSIADLAAQQKAKLAAARWAYVQAGTVTVGGATIRTDDGSRAEIEALHGVLRDEVIASVKFKPANGSPVEVGLSAVAAIRAAITLFYQAARQHEADLIDEIDAAVTADSRAAVAAVVWTQP